MLFFTNSVITCLCLETVKEPQKTFELSLQFLLEDEMVAIDIRRAVNNLSSRAALS